MFSQNHDKFFIAINVLNMNRLNNQTIKCNTDGKNNWRNRCSHTHTHTHTQLQTGTIIHEVEHQG